VACTSANACTAVGAYNTSTNVPLPLAERWNGSSWTVQPTPTPPNATASVLQAVSCTSATACTAVGRHPVDDRADSNADRHAPGTRRGVVHNPDSLHCRRNHHQHRKQRPGDVRRTDGALERHQLDGCAHPGSDGTPPVGSVVYFAQRMPCRRANQRHQRRDLGGILGRLHVDGPAHA
jgi:hypothetical protein